MVSDAGMARGRRPLASCSLGAIWEWRDVSMPSGKGIEAPVEEVSGEVETKDLFKATLPGQGKIVPVRKMKSCTWAIVPTVSLGSEALRRKCFLIS